MRYRNLPASTQLQKIRSIQKTLVKHVDTIGEKENQLAHQARLIKEKDQAIQQQKELIESHRREIASQENKLIAQEKSMNQYLASIAETKDLI